MNTSPCLTRIVFFTLTFAYLCLNIAAQDKPERGEDPFRNEAWDHADPAFTEKYSKRESADITNVDKKVRLIYLVPSDRSVRSDYKAAIADGALHLQDFFQRELGSNNAYLLNDPIVEVYHSTRSVNYYQTHDPGSGNTAGYFWENVLLDGFSLTGGNFNDPNNRWIYYVDAQPLCNQYTGGNAGVALLPANDLRGLNGESNINPCGGPPADTAGKYRWIGGAGHEIAHAFNVPHPPGCGSGGPWSGCTGGQMAAESIMWLGFYPYPNTYFLPTDRSDLLSSGYFSSMDLRAPRSADFDNDRKSDLSVWRPSNGYWYTTNSATGNISYTGWGSSDDVIVPGDYDGDRKTDSAVWRPSDRTWYIFNSADSTYTFMTYGSTGDIPVAADYDGDRKTDIAVWRPGDGTWYIYKSASATHYALAFGAAGDRPVAADYDGDKRTDLAVFRPGDATWYVHRNYLSSYYYTNPPANGNIVFYGARYGLSSDKNVPADYDGDGKADIAVWRPSTGIWYYLASSNGSSNQVAFGQTGDIPAPGDYDNDGYTDVGVFRPSNGDWYVNPTAGSWYLAHWGTSGDIPVESAYVR